MKAIPYLFTIAAGMLCLPLMAQNPSEALIEPVAEAVGEAAAEVEAVAEGTSPAEAPSAPRNPLIEPTSPPAADDSFTPDLPLEGAPPVEVEGPGPGPDAGEGVEPSDEGFMMKNAALNDIFQYLAKQAGRQYFHNSKISGPQFSVTGHLNQGDPLQQMDELAFMYGLSLHTKGNTIYALDQSQLAQLPSSEFHYQLRYLRPSDVEAIKDLIRPVLSPGTGIVNFEPKTNTIIIIDSAHRIEAAQRLLHGVDKPKGQIIVETKILRVNSGAAERTGVDWSGSLGETGTTLGLSRSLNAVFGIDNIAEEAAGSLFESANLVLSPIQMSGVLRALADGELATQVSNPTLITEDNEQATISIIDRIPIITTSSTQTTTGGNPTVTEEVRYKIDQGDQSIDTSPEQHREIGISLVITPTLLPDGTVRMKMRPRTAQITGFTEGVNIAGVGANQYPNVTESMIETLARIPDGHSLVVGGFYGEVDSDKNNKVPVLGDIPVINFFFKSKETVKEKTSLVFIVTPTSYDPASGLANKRAADQIRTSTTLPRDYNWIDPHNPGPAHQPNLQRTLRGMQPNQAPYYPRAKVISPPAGSR